MSEEKKTPVKAEEGKGSKFVNWIKNLPANIAKPFKNMVAELRKVTWPSKKKLISSCITVLLFMLFMGVVVSLLDMGSAAIVNGVDDLGNQITATATPEAPVAPTAEPNAEPTPEVTVDPAAATDAPAGADNQ